MAGKRNVKIAQVLRKKMTDAERKLWGHLRAKQVHSSKFRRQEPIGRFIADFASYPNRLIIEIDGSQHALNVAGDAQRDGWFVEQGYQVLRFSNFEVLTNIDGVLAVIWEACNHPPPAPSPQGRGK